MHGASLRDPFLKIQSFRLLKGCTRLYKNLSCTRIWVVQESELYKILSCSVQRSELYTNLSCTRIWVVQEFELYKILSCTIWVVQESELYKILSCTIWVVQKSYLYIINISNLLSLHYAKLLLRLKIVTDRFFKMDLNTMLIRWY